MAQIIEIPCNPAVDCQSVNAHVNRCPEGCDNCRHAVQKVRLLATEAPESCRKDLQITCISDHMHLCFWSGSRGNKIVVQVTEGKVEVTTSEKTWKESLRDFFRNNKKKIAGIIVLVVGNAVSWLGGPVPAAIAGVATTIGASALFASDGENKLEKDKLYRLTN